MLHLFDEDGLRLDNAIKNKKYWKWIKRNPEKIQSFLIGSKDSGISPNSNKNLFLDSYGLLKKLFFENSNYKINHLCVNPDGSVLIFYGGEDILIPLDFSI